MYRSLRKLLFGIVLFATVNASFGTAAVTYQLSGGRFGDNLIAFCHALWLAYKHNILLLYTPFKYGEQLVLGHITHVDSYKYMKKVTITEAKIGKIKTELNRLYDVPYFSEFEIERNFPWNKNWIYFPVDWNDPKFCEQIRMFIRPINEELLNAHLPTDCITVAMHVRRGGSFEGPLLADASAKDGRLEYIDINVPLRFPPDSFYLEQLKRISQLFNHQKLYVFIFTDLEKPAQFVDKMQRELSEYPNIVFDYRKQGNSHNANVVEDFFAMTQFDCLIRPQSNFSLAASKVGNYKVEISPTKHHWEDTKSIVDEIEIVYNRTVVGKIAKEVE